jgi:3-hydroxyisobutyrate dehydrogenase
MPDLSVAFLGLGTMGGGMAARLLDTRGPIAVWNRHRAKADVLAARGAHVAASPRDAADGADVVIAMVADDAASRRVWLADDGVLAGVKRGAVLIESSTVSPPWIDELSTEAERAGCTLIDAPVTGSKTQAASGQLRFLVGGDATTLERVRPVLEAMSNEIVYIGPLGSAARLKLINNVVCAVQAVSLAEAITLMERSGLDVTTALSVLTNGAPGSPVVRAVGPRMTTPDYTVNFGLNLMHKDVRYAIDEAARFGVPMMTATAARDRLTKALEAGLGEKDFSAVIETLRAERRQ